MRPRVGQRQREQLFRRRLWENDEGGGPFLSLSLSLCRAHRSWLTTEIDETARDTLAAGEERDETVLRGPIAAHVVG